jgi:integrase
LITFNATIPPVFAQDSFTPHHFGRLGISADMLFPDAAAAYMAIRAPEQTSARYIRKTTEISYRQYIGTLQLFFGKMRMCDIRSSHLREYQSARVAGAEPFVRKRRPQDKEATSCPAKAKKINQELGLLKHLMNRAGAWSNELEELYQPLLDDEEELPRALSPEEQAHWLHVCRLSPRWNVVYWYSLLAFGTCMSTDEIRGLRLADINLFQRVISIARKTSKNRYRSRTIELVGADLLWAIEQLVARAKDLGVREHHHYLFPSRISVGVWKLEAPMTESGIKKLWLEVRAASKLTWFRQYDCRHTAISRLAESGVPIDVIMSCAGHVSEKMRQHYTHISQGAQRRWMEHSASRHYSNSQTSRAENPWVPQSHFQSVPGSCQSSSPVAPAPIAQQLKVLQEQNGLTDEQMRQLVSGRFDDDSADAVYIRKEARAAPRLVVFPLERVSRH